jgi:hypothetical protein
LLLASSSASSLAVRHACSRCHPNLRGKSAENSTVRPSSSPTP